MVPVSPGKNTVGLDADEATVPLFDGVLKSQGKARASLPLPAPAPKLPLPAPSALSAPSPSSAGDAPTVSLVSPKALVPTPSAPSAPSPASVQEPAKNVVAPSKGAGVAVVERPVSIDQLCRTQGVLDYYALLNISRDASGEEVRAAYLRFNRLAHPMTTDEGLAHLFQAAQDAYDVLSNEQKRKAYDEHLSLITGAVEHEVRKGVPLGTFPVVELADLSWADKLDEASRDSLARPRIVPGGSPHSYGKAVVANAVDLLMSIPGVSSFENIVTPEGSADYVFMRKGVVIVFSGLVLAEEDRESALKEELRSLLAVSEQIRESMPKISPPEVITFAAVLPRCTTYHKQRILSLFDGKITPGDLIEIVDEIGNKLFDARSSLMEGTYKRKLGWLRK